MAVHGDPKAVAFAGLGLVSLVGGSLASLWLPGDDLVLGVIGAVAGYVLCGRCALSRWRADARVFDHPFWRGPVTLGQLRKL